MRWRRLLEVKAYTHSVCDGNGTRIVISETGFATITDRRFIYRKYIIVIDKVRQLFLINRKVKDYVPGKEVTSD